MVAGNPSLERLTCYFCDEKAAPFEHDFKRRPIKYNDGTNGVEVLCPDCDPLR